MGDPADPASKMGPLVSHDHCAKAGCDVWCVGIQCMQVRSYIALAVSEGATVECGGLDPPAVPPHCAKACHVLY